MQSPPLRRRRRSRIRKLKKLLFALVPFALLSAAVALSLGVVSAVERGEAEEAARLAEEAAAAAQATEKLYLPRPPRVEPPGSLGLPDAGREEADIRRALGTDGIAPPAEGEPPAALPTRDSVDLQRDRHHAPQNDPRGDAALEAELQLALAPPVIPEPDSGLLLGCGLLLLAARASLLRPDTSKRP